MKTPEDFYRERDKRTDVYIRGKSVSQVPINIFLDEEAALSLAGQGCALALANLLPRVHRRIRFILPRICLPLMAPALWPMGDFPETLLATMQRIDPFGEFAVAEKPYPNAMSLGIGHTVPTNLTWYIGAAGAIAILATE